MQKKALAWSIGGNIVALLCCVVLFVWVSGQNQEIKALELNAQMLKTELGSRQSSTGEYAFWDALSVWDAIYALRNSMAFNEKLVPKQSYTSSEKMYELETALSQLKRELGFYQPISAISPEVRVNCFMNRAGQISCRAPN